MVAMGNSTLWEALSLISENQDIFEKCESYSSSLIGCFHNTMKLVGNSNYFEAGFIFLLA